MTIDVDAFINWISSHFDNYQVNGDEIKVPDMWWHKEDTDNSVWINTQKCCFRAFKSGKTGHLVEFIMEVEGCDWDEAVELIGGESLHNLENKLIKFFNNETIQQPIKITSAKLPEGTFNISDLPVSSPIRQDAEQYLSSRKIICNNLMVCVAGKYKNRIVIPYYDKNKKLIYFNTRTLSSSPKAIRYLGPPKEEFNVGKSDVLWMSHWAKSGKVYITEGEFDAMSLATCGFLAGACGGKSMSETQINMLKPYHIVLAFDSDEAGKDSFELVKKIMEFNKVVDSESPNISLIRPPIGYKDWNDLLIKHNEDIVRAYISKEEKICGSEFLGKVKFNDINSTY